MADKTKTYEELSNLLPERDIKTFSVKERINIANALFIKNSIVVKDDFKKLMVDKNIRFPEDTLAEDTYFYFKYLLL